MSSSRPTGSLASLLIAILLAFTIPAGALRAQMNNNWQIQQQRQQEMLRQQQMQQEQMRRQQQEQLRQQQRQQLQAQQRQQMQAQQRQQMQAQQRQAMQQQQQQALQQQQRNKLQKQQIDQAKNAQQVGKPPPTGTPAHIANKPTGPMVFSNGVARLTRPLTPAEISRGFTGKVTPNGRALIKFQGRIFAVPASRVSGLTAKPAAQQRQARWTAQQQGSINEKVKRLTAATTTPPPPPPPKSELNDRRPGGGGGDAGGPCDPGKSLTCNLNTQATKPGPAQVVKSPAIQARIDAARAAMLQNQNAKVAESRGTGDGGISDKFNAKSIAPKIAAGHGFQKHVIEKGDVPSFVKTQKDYAAHIEKVMMNHSAQRKLKDGRMAYWDEETKFVVITSPSDKKGDYGTAFCPEKGRKFFEELE